MGRMLYGTMSLSNVIFFKSEVNKLKTYSTCLMCFQTVHSSPVNFQVPLIIIVRHQEAPPLPLLPLPMTVTSYHGNPIKQPDRGYGLHIVPV